MCKVYLKTCRLFLMNKGVKKLIKIENEVARFAFASVCSIKDIKKVNVLAKKIFGLKDQEQETLLQKLIIHLLEKRSLKILEKIHR